MGHAIRRATARDRAAVEEVVREAYRPWPEVIGTRPAPMDADYAALIAGGDVFVAEPERGPRGRVDGVLVLSPDADALVVDNVAVHPRLHGRGLGRALMAFAEEQARSRGLAAMRLHTHERMERNLALYGALGYRRTGTMPVEAGHVVLMRKDLGPV